MPPKKELLAFYETRYLLTLQSDYERALQKRALNAGDFATNITYLEEIAEICHDWTQFLWIHMEREAKAKDQMESKYDCFGFFRNRARENYYHEKEIIAAARKMITDDIADVFKETFSKEPRIKGISYIERHLNPFSENLPQKLIEEYKIKFSDNSFITLSDLKPHTVAKAKIEFEAKMKSLADLNQVKVQVTKHEENAEEKMSMRL